MESVESIPWVEKYRPSKFDDIVLDPNNKKILSNIVKRDHFPNLLFYGPPGTGKTTTIISLINKYQEHFNQKYKGLMIHLNASDERGIDIIRNQINHFVSSSGLFNKGLKFVILDEVDYMTKNAQQALKYLLQKCNNNVRFCLICNYISRIDVPLQNEFIRLRFNQLPNKDIYNFLNNISLQEGLNLSNNSIKSIQKMYKSDIRSMINYMQSNQNLTESYMIIEDEQYKNLSRLLTNNSLSECELYINEISKKYNVDKRSIFKNYFNYLITNNIELITSQLLNFIENALHNETCNLDHYVNYCLLELICFFKKQSKKGGEEDKGTE